LVGQAVDIIMYAFSEVYMLASVIELLIDLANSTHWNYIMDLH